MPDLVLVSRRVVTPEGIRPAAIVISDGRIVEVAPHDAYTGPPASRDDADADEGGEHGDRRRRDVVEDLGDLVILPGLVDSHVHVNDPGRTYWEGFTSATRAAAAGGITTIVDMPLNCVPPTTTVAALDEKREVAREQAHVDLAFWGGAVPGNERDLGPLHDAGVCGFKAFLCDSGVEEYGHVDPEHLDELVLRTAALGATLIVHAEHPGILEEATAAVADELATGRRDRRAYASWLDSRPPEAEERAIAALVAALYQAESAVPPPVAQEPTAGTPVPDPAVPDSVLAGGTGGGVAAGAGPPAQADGGSVSPGRPGRAHVLHLSAASAGAIVAAAKADGVAITAETCPHYLTFAAEDVPDGATDHKCAPPIRDRANQERMWELLADGTIDAIVSDHSPCPPEDKRLDDGDFVAAWGGISSLQVGLSVVWAEARARGFGLDDVVGWMAAGPARIAGLEGKGAIVTGADADLVVFDPDAVWTVDAASLHHRHAISPYHGREVRGTVRRAYLGGELVARDGEVVGPPRGRLHRRGQRRRGPR